MGASIAGEKLYMEILDFLFDIKIPEKKSFLCELPFQILLTNLSSNLKGFFMLKLSSSLFGHFHLPRLVSIPLSTVTRGNAVAPVCGGQWFLNGRTLKNRLRQAHYI